MSNVKLKIYWSHAIFIVIGNTRIAIHFIAKVGIAIIIIGYCNLLELRAMRGALW
jgi:hypothetical protein